MNTDKLFHEYFQVAPQALFELFQIVPGCAYRFSSPVVKQNERRMDGLLEPAEPGYPRYYLEVQGYPDSTIYWRQVQQIGLHHAQNVALNGSDWRAVVLFLDSDFDPGIQTLGPLAQGTAAWLIKGVLSDLLESVAHPSTWLNVLRPLVADRATIQQQANHWASTIQKESQFDDKIRFQLLELLVMIIVQRFENLPRKEVEKMLQLTPIEQTRVGQELIELGIERGEMKILSRLIASKFQVAPRSVMAQLRQLAPTDFETLGEYILQAQTYAEIKRWIRVRAPKNVRQKGARQPS